MNSAVTLANPLRADAVPATRQRRPRDTSRANPATAAGALAAAAVPLQALRPEKPGGSSQVWGIAAVVGVHALVAYALSSGLAQQVVQTVRAPFEARLIEEIKPPPPPPPEAKIKPVVKVAAPPPPFVPPPEVQVAAQPPAPTIAAVTPVAPPAPVEFRPEPPAAPPAPPPAAPAPINIGVACPTMVAPVMPRRAEQEGIGGQVTARATIRDGRVVDVQILASSPRGLFDAAVRTAMAKYGCSTTGTNEIVATQTFQFRSAR